MIGGATQQAANINLATMLAIAGVDFVAVRRWGSKARPGGYHDRGTLTLVRVTTTAALAIGAFAPEFIESLNLPVNAVALALTGAAIATTGILIRLWAIRTLGRQFRRVVSKAPGDYLVTDGPYRSVRHPSYTGALLAFAGLGVGFGNWASLIACLVLPALGYVARIRVEERFLVETFGDAYRTYAARTARLIPRMW